ncbi:MAG TPA: LPS assembly lipoprotein LptE, partial [Burkholderiaceae bacterium]
PDAGARSLGRAVAGALAALALSGLAGCGFHLTVPEDLNYQRIALTGFADRSTMAEEIRRALPPGAHVVPTMGESQVVVQAVEDTRNTTVEASTAFGQVRELELHVKLRYRVLLPDGQELLPLADLERFRDVTYDEKDALAKDTEVNLLYRDLQSDMANQLVRVLAAVGRPGGPAARIGAALAASAVLPAASAASASAQAPRYQPSAPGGWGAAPAAGSPASAAAQDATH